MKLSTILTNMKRDHTNLREGPGQKNKALQDVEYIVHSLAGIDYQSSNPEYKQTQKEIVTTIAFNSLSHILITCPNGRTYNLSCALKNANLDYLQFIIDSTIPESPPEIETGETADNHKERLALYNQRIADNKRNGDLIAALSGQKLAIALQESRTLSGEIHTIFDAESRAIARYTSDLYEKYNALLRGDSKKFFNAATPNKKDLKLTLFSALLAISGVNKNVDASFKEIVLNDKGGIDDNASSTKPTAFRKDENLPPGLLTEIASPNSLVRHGGLMSFSSVSEDDSEKHLHEIAKRPITTRIAASRQKTVEPASENPDEREILFPPIHLLYTKNTTTDDKLEAEAQLIWGLASEHTDNYTVDLALAEAYDYLKMPYADTPLEIVYGINRYNHALAHHTRVVSYTDYVIAYFSNYAKDSALQSFCKMLSHTELNLIKVVLAFSKTGRESEAGFLDNPTAYRTYQESSCNKMAKFMRETLGLSDDDIMFYRDIQMEMGDPNYDQMATEPNRDKKIFIHHIIALAHKLDLPRCYDRSKVKEALAAYGEVDNTDSVVALSSEQRIALDDLQKLALTTLRETGDNIFYSEYGVSERAIHQDQFQLCNTDLLHCQQACLQAAQMTMNPLEENNARFVENMGDYYQDYATQEAFKKAFYNAAVLGKVTKLKFLLTLTSPTLQIDQADINIGLRQAANEKQWDVCEFLCELKGQQKPHISSIEFCLEQAFHDNNYTLVKKILSDKTNLAISDFFIFKITYGAMLLKPPDIELIQLAAKKLTDINLEKCFLKAIATGSVVLTKTFGEILKTQDEKDIVSAVTEGFIDALVSDKIDCIDYFLDEFKELFMKQKNFIADSLYKAIQDGKFEIAHRLLAFDREAINKTFKSVVTNENLEMLKWILSLPEDKGPDQKTKEAMFLKIKFAHSNDIALLLRQFNPDPTVNQMVDELKEIVERDKSTVSTASKNPRFMPHTIQKTRAFDDLLSVLGKVISRDDALATLTNMKKHSEYNDNEAFRMCLENCISVTEKQRVSHGLKTR